MNRKTNHTKPIQSSSNPQSSSYARYNNQQRKKPIQTIQKYNNQQNKGPKIIPKKRPIWMNTDKPRKFQKKNKIQKVTVFRISHFYFGNLQTYIFFGVLLIYAQLS